MCLEFTVQPMCTPCYVTTLRGGACDCAWVGAQGVSVTSRYQFLHTRSRHPTAVLVASWIILRNAPARYRIAAVPRKFSFPPDLLPQLLSLASEHRAQHLPCASPFRRRGVRSPPLQIAPMQRTRFHILSNGRQFFPFSLLPSTGATGFALHVMAYKCATLSRCILPAQFRRRATTSLGNTRRLTCFRFRSLSRPIHLLFPL